MTSTAFEIFPWSNYYCVGIEEIDVQHKELIRLLNELTNCIALQQDIPKTKQAFDAFISYSRFHLTSEEKLWQESLQDDDALQHHKDTHVELVDGITSLQSKYASMSREQVLKQTLSFLTHWLIGHILIEDRYMAKLIFAINAGMPLDAAQQSAKQQISGTHHDITELIDSLYESLSAVTLHLSQSASRLREVMDYAKIGHWDLPFKGTRANWSDEMYELFGLSQKAQAGPETLCSIMNKDYHSTFFDSLQVSFETGKEHHVEYPIVRPNDGQTRWIECRGRLVYRDNGQPEKLSGFVQDITQHKETEKKIEQLSLFDALTKLPNRRHLLACLEQALASCGRSQHNSALLFLDVDHFKTLNETHGHDYGDQLLIQTTKRLKSCLRQEDTFARIGGDEFVIILEHLSKDPMLAALQAEIISNKILSAQTSKYQLSDVSYSCSLSIGVVLFNGGATTSSELLKQADIAMYQAKLAGRNTLRFFDPIMQEKITEQVKLENDLRSAIKEDQFELYYQPQTNHLGAITGTEALIRWHHPERGLLTPGDFISLAEETGLIVPMGLWVLQSACAQLKVWQKDPATSQLHISVNVSPKQFRQKNFVAQVKDLLDHYEITPKLLKIELTESLLLDDLERTTTQMEELGAMGVQFSLDDFGTGYSSLLYLKRLPLFQLKIDQSFIQDLITDHSDQSIVRTIISMANGLGLDVIAEGVETEQQQQHLLNEGCYNYQGYLFGKPSPVDELISQVLRPTGS